LIYNVYSVSGLIFSGISAAAGAGAAVSGFSAVRRAGKFPLEGERLARFEERESLAVLLAAVGLAARLAVLFVWFAALRSFIPSIPGAMCLAGVHSAGAPWSFISSILKVVLPLVYITWFVLHRTDRVQPDRPFAALKLRMLLPVGLLLVFEGVSDILYLVSLRPVRVACCTSLFDLPTNPILETLATGSPAWMIVAALAPAVVLILTGWKRAAASIAAAAVAAAGSVLFLIGLHTWGSPKILSAPFHHCVFCLLGQSLLTAVAGFIFITHSWAAASAAMTRGLHLARSIAVPRGLHRLLRIGMTGMWAGLILLAAAVLLSGCAGGGPGADSGTTLMLQEHELFLVERESSGARRIRCLQHLGVGVHSPEAEKVKFSVVVEDSLPPDITVEIPPAEADSFETKTIYGKPFMIELARPGPGKTRYSFRDAPAVDRYAAGSCCDCQDECGGGCSVEWDVVNQPLVEPEHWGSFSLEVSKDTLVSGGNEQLSVRLSGRAGGGAVLEKCSFVFPVRLPEAILQVGELPEPLSGFTAGRIKRITWEAPADTAADVDITFPMRVFCMRPGEIGIPDFVSVKASLPGLRYPEMVLVDFPGRKLKEITRAATSSVEWREPFSVTIIDPDRSEEGETQG